MYKCYGFKSFQHHMSNCHMMHYKYAARCAVRTNWNWNCHWVFPHSGTKEFKLNWNTKILNSSTIILREMICTLLIQCILSSSVSVSWTFYCLCIVGVTFFAKPSPLRHIKLCNVFNPCWGTMFPGDTPTVVYWLLTVKVQVHCKSHIYLMEACFK